MQAGEVPVVDVGNAVRAAGDVVSPGQPEERDAIPVLHDCDEELEEEQRDDCEVVADEAPRRQCDEEAENRRTEDDHGENEQRVPVQAELRRGEHRVEIRAEAVERDVPEVEQPGKADHDAQAECEQHVEQRVEADADDVAVARDERKQSGGDGEPEVERGPRRAHDLVAQAPPEPLAALAAVVVARDPRVDANLRHQRPALVGTVGDRCDVVAARHQTFCSDGRPSSPLGRMSMTAIRSANTIACWNVEDR